MQTPAQIIEAKGGAAKFAEAIGVKHTRVRVWKHRNQFPRTYWPEIGRAFPELGTDELLASEAAGQTANADDAPSAPHGEAAA